MKRHWLKITGAVLVALALASTALSETEIITGFSSVSSAGNGGGLVGDATGDINMEGNKLCLDLDKDSCLESPIDDDIDFTTGTVLTLRLSSGTASFLGNTTFNGALMNLADGSFWRLGPGLDTVFVHSTFQTPDSALLGLGAESNCMAITQFLDAAGTTDFACPDLGNPQLRWQAADETDITKWGNWLHDGVDFVADAGTGGIRIKPAFSVDGAATFNGTVSGTLVKQLAAFTGNDVVLPPTDPVTVLSRNGHPILVFEDTTDKCAVFRRVLPPGYFSSNNIVVKVFHMAATATTGNARFDGQWENLSGQDLDVDGFATAVVGPTTATSGTSGILSTSTITFTNTQADSVLAGQPTRVKICRDNTVASNVVGDIEVSDISVDQAIP